MNGKGIKTNKIKQTSALYSSMCTPLGQSSYNAYQPRKSENKKTSRPTSEEYVTNSFTNTVSILIVTVKHTIKFSRKYNSADGFYLGIIFRVTDGHCLEHFLCWFILSALKVKTSGKKHVTLSTESL